MASAQKPEDLDRLLALAALLRSVPVREPEPAPPCASVKKSLLNLEKIKTRNILI